MAVHILFNTTRLVTGKLWSARR